MVLQHRPQFLFYSDIDYFLKLIEDNYYFFILMFGVSIWEIKNFIQKGLLLILMDLFYT